MKTISDDQQRPIDDAIGELSLALSPAILEKDILVTEALRAISQVNLPGLALTFSGGTCLSKAYQRLERMSEDIDLRLRPRIRTASAALLILPNGLAEPGRTELLETLTSSRARALH